MSKVEFLKKRDEILSVTTELLMNHSYATVNISTIAQTCGVTKAAIYYHFKNKRELVKECLSIMLKEVHYIFASSADRAIPIKEKLTLICGDLINLTQSNPGMLTIFLRSLSERELMTIFEEMNTEVDLLFDEIGQIIRCGLEANEVREKIDPKLVSRMLTGTVVMYLQTNIISNNKINLDPAALIDVLFNGIANCKEK